MVAESGGSEASELNVRRYFGGRKGAVLGIRKVWQGWGMQVGREVTESDVGSDGSWYYGTETGDDRVGV